MKVVKKNRQFLWGLLAFAAVLFFYYYDKEVKPINATMMAFSYRYGFVSRGFIGTLFQGICSICPKLKMDYAGVKVFCLLATLLFFALFFLLIKKLLRCAGEGASDALYGAIMILTIFTVPTFVCKYNFGRFDMYLCLLTVVAVLLLLSERAEFLVILLAAVGVMIHQGYVFMYLNVILVILFFKWMSAEGVRAKKYFGLFTATFILSSALFLYFEFFSHMNGSVIYEDVTLMAKQLCSRGQYHKDVIDAEILGVDLADREWNYHIMNFAQLPIFIVLAMPYIVLGVKFFGGMIRQADGTRSRWKYLAVSVGALTLLPNFILKIDYGRWMYALIFYYAIMVLWLLAMRDEIAIEQMKTTVKSVREYPISVLLLAYPILLTPFWDVAINRICSVFAGIPNDLWWHIW